MLSLAGFLATADGEDLKQIQEALKSAAAKEENDNTPEGLAYHVNAFELEVEKWGSLNPHIHHVRTGTFQRHFVSCEAKRPCPGWTAVTFVAPLQGACAFKSA